jgi:hypothetical protein
MTIIRIIISMIFVLSKFVEPVGVHKVTAELTS